jgi:hypothetical protein
MPLAAIIIAPEHGTLLEWYCRSSVLDGQEFVRAAREVLLNELRSEFAAARQAPPG